MRTIAHIPRRLTPRSWGGTERVLSQTLPLLRRAGLEQRVLTTRALDDEPIGDVGGVPVARFTYGYPEWPLSAERRERYDRCGGNLVSFPLARRLMHLRDLALVHCHTGNRLAAQCLQVARRRGVPFVVTLHGGHFAVPEDERRRWQQRRGASAAAAEGSDWTIPWGKVLSLMWGTRTLLERADAVVCVGIEEFEVARAQLRGSRVVLLPGGVDPDVFAAGSPERGRRLLGIPADARLMICVARLDPQKDQQTLVRAWLSLEDPSCYLALVGPETEPGYAALCRQLAGAAADRIRIVESLASEKVPDVLAAAQVAVLPSRHEPFGLSCLEAWAARRCLVAADVGGPRWLLRDGTAGRLFPPGDHEALRALLRELLDDDTQRERLARAGARRAQEEFTWERRAEGLLSLYRALGVRWTSPLVMSPTPRSGGAPRLLGEGTP